MNKNGVAIATILVFLLVSSTCEASMLHRLQKSKATEQNNSSATTQVSPTGSPVNESNANPINAGKSQHENEQESRTGKQNITSNGTSATNSMGSKKTDKDDKVSGASGLPASEKNFNISANATTPGIPAGEDNINKTLGQGNGKSATPTTPGFDDSLSCKGSLTSCKDREILACIKTSKHSGSKQMFLVVQNEGESTLKVKVNSADQATDVMPPFEVPKGKTRKVIYNLLLLLHFCNLAFQKNISSVIGKSTALTLNSGDAKCVLYVVNPVSVDNLMRQLSFYSKKVTPVYALYASGLLILFFGGTLACCKLRKRNKKDGIPYQELEMGLPDSATVTADAAEGWDRDWDDDDWDDSSALRSPASHGLSANGLTSRSSKKDGWEHWDD